MLAVVRSRQKINQFPYYVLLSPMQKKVCLERIVFNSSQKNQGAALEIQ